MIGRLILTGLLATFTLWGMAYLIPKKNLIEDYWFKLVLTALFLLSALFTIILTFIYIWTY